MKIVIILLAILLVCSASYLQDTEADSEALSDSCKFLCLSQLPFKTLFISN